jgi:hypothetical protein
MNTKYRIKFWLKDGSTHLWERFGTSMEECFSLTKIAIEREYGERWNQSAMICGPQFPTDIYAF